MFEVQNESKKAQCEDADEVRCKGEGLDASLMHRLQRDVIGWSFGALLMWSR
jgi:hypothetical protein